MNIPYYYIKLTIYVEFVCGKIGGWSTSVKYLREIFFCEIFFRADDLSFFLERKEDRFLLGVGGVSSNRRRLTEECGLRVEVGFWGIPGESDKDKSSAESAGSVKGGRSKSLGVVGVWCSLGVRVLFCEKGVEIFVVMSNETLGKSGRVGK